MAWEWSHTEDTYGYAEEQLGKLSLETLREIAEEWKTKLNDMAEEAFEYDRQFDEDDAEIKPFVAPNTIDVSNTGERELVTFIWSNASDYEHVRACSNGGHEIYLCPDGCHTVDLGDMPKDWSPEEY